MNYETFLLAKTALDSGQMVTLVSSPDALQEVVKTKRGTRNWIAESAFIRWLAGVQTKTDSLLLLDRPRPSQAPILRARFAMVWTPDDGLKFLPKDELIEVVGSSKRDELFVGGVVDEVEEVVLLLRGNLRVVEAPFRMFQPSGTTKPDFSKFAVVDYGTAVAFGEYTATADSILYELDSTHRKKVKERRLTLNDSFGGSLRRLRMLRGLSQTDFAPGVSAKEVGRIESGKITKPRDETVKRLAKKLGVSSNDIASY